MHISEHVLKQEISFERKQPKKLGLFGFLKHNFLFCETSLIKDLMYIYGMRSGYNIVNVCMCARNLFLKYIHTFQWQTSFWKQFSSAKMSANMHLSMKIRAPLTFWRSLMEFKNVFQEQQQQQISLFKDRVNEASRSKSQSHIF